MFKTAIVLLGLAGASVLTPAAATASCAAADTLGLDLSYSAHRDSLPPAFLSKAIGQTFYAPDTLLSSFTVWRRRDGGVLWTLVKLWILRADADGNFFTNREVTYEGPLVAFYGEVEPVEMRFEFDPPLVLPAKGWYYATVQDPCSLYFELYTSYVDRVPGHWARTTRRNLSGCGLGVWDDLDESWDLCYRAVFCRDSVDPVRQRTWGQLKILYR